MEMENYQILYDLPKKNRPSSNSGATALPPIGYAFLHIETSSNNHGQKSIRQLREN